MKSFLLILALVVLNVVDAQVTSQAPPYMLNVCLGNSMPGYVGLWWYNSGSTANSNSMFLRDYNLLVNIEMISDYVTEYNSNDCDLYAATIEDYMDSY